MVLVDDRILEIIRQDPDGIGKVGELGKHKNIKAARSTVSRRCGKLAEHGLLRKRGDGVYIITQKGQRYLNGEISTYVDELDEIRDQEDDEGDTGVPSPQSPG